MTRALTWLLVVVLAAMPWVGPELLVAVGLAANLTQAWVVVSTTICAVWTPAVMLAGVFADAWAYPHHAAIAKATGAQA